jgi:homoserine O-acetyltransferase
LSVAEIGDTIDSSSEIPNIQSVVLSRDLRFTLESGRRFGPINVAYKTFGRLNSDKSNAVFVFPTLTATPQVAAEETGGKLFNGWWEGLIGKGRAIDTRKYFVICADHFGGCYGTTGPSSVNPDTGKPYGLDFPGFFIRDMANVVLEFLRAIGIERLHMVVGASIGGLLALELIGLENTVAEKALIFGASHRVSAQFLALNYIARESIMLDPAWNAGHYYGGNFPEKGLSIARQIGHISYLNHLLLEKKFGRQVSGTKQRKHISLNTQYQIESYLDYQGRKFCKRFDPNTYIYLSKAIDTFDLYSDFGSIKDAFGSTETKFSFITISSDNLFMPSDTKQLHTELKTNGLDSAYAEINSPKGHDGIFLESQEIGKLIRKSFR